MIRGAIFDVDGTLFDSMQLWRNFGCNYLRRRGKEPDEVTERAVRYMSLAEAAEHFKNDCGISGTVAEIEDDCNKMLEEYYFNIIKLREGVADLLSALSDAGVPMAVATATDRYLVEEAMRREGIFDYFSGISTCAEAGAGKDKPDVFVNAQSIIKTEASETWIFEDARHAVITAKKSGYKVCAIYDETESDHVEEIRALSDIYVRSFAGFDISKL